MSAAVRAAAAAEARPRLPRLPFEGCGCGTCVAAVAAIDDRAVPGHWVPFTDDPGMADAARWRPDDQEDPS
jgi:hypothetical protein